MPLKGIDVSSWQPNINWPTVAASGVDFAIVKASGGAHYRNPRYRQQIDGARAAGLIVGHYHYAHELSFDPPKRTPEEEADYFLATIDARPGELVALDIEDPEAHGNLSGWALAWLTRVEAALGCAPLLYTYPYYAIERSLTAPALAHYPLWWASYDKPPRNAPAPWHDWTILQYTAFATVPGIGPNIDENMFKGNRAQLAALGIPSEHSEREGPPAEAGGVRWYTNDLGNAIAEINFGGEFVGPINVNFADVGVTGTGTDGATYDRSIQAGKFQPFVKR